MFFKSTQVFFYLCKEKNGKRHSEPKLRFLFGNCLESPSPLLLSTIYYMRFTKFQNRPSEGPQKPEELTLSKIKYEKFRQKSNFMFIEKMLKILKFVNCGQIRSILKNWHHQKMMFFSIRFYTLRYPFFIKSSLNYI